MVQLRINIINNIIHTRHHTYLHYDEDNKFRSCPGIKIYVPYKVDLNNFHFISRTSKIGIPSLRAPTCGQVQLTPKQTLGSSIEIPCNQMWVNILKYTLGIKEESPERGGSSSGTLTHLKITLCQSLTIPSAHNDRSIMITPHLMDHHLNYGVFQQDAVSQCKALSIDLPESPSHIFYRSSVKRSFKSLGP